MMSEAVEDFFVRFRWISVAGFMILFSEEGDFGLNLD